MRGKDCDEFFKIPQKEQGHLKLLSVGLCILRHMEKSREKPQQLRNKEFGFFNMEKRTECVWI